jgi:hypothetical protein
LSIVRIGSFIVGKESGERNINSNRNGIKNSNQSQIVLQSTLDYLVEEKMKQLKASDLSSNPYWKYTDIRKKVYILFLLLFNFIFQNKILENADVVCCTLSGAGSQPILG